MKKIFYLFIGVMLIVSATSCSENYSNGERIGFVNKFSKKGLFWKSWEGELNLTQTGMNTSSVFDFSVDNDVNDPVVIATLDSAAIHGWKVKIKYHEVTGWNWFKNRGETDDFVTEVTVLDKNMVNNIKNVISPGSVKTEDNTAIKIQKVKIFDNDSNMPSEVLEVYVNKWLTENKGVVIKNVICGDHKVFIFY